MQERDIVPLRQELRNRLFLGELGELAVPVQYKPGNGTDTVEVPMRQEGLIVSGRGTQLSVAMIAYADTKLDMALNVGHPRDNLLRANNVLQTLRETAGAASSRIVTLTNTLVRDILSSHGIVAGHHR